MVEVAGVEPASPVFWFRASTGLAFLFMESRRAVGEKARFCRPAPCWFTARPRTPGWGYACWRRLFCLAGVGKETLPLN